MLAVRKTSTGVRARHAALSSSPATARSWPTCASYGDEAVLCVANLARSAQPVELDLARYKGRVPVEMLGRTAFPPIGELPYLLTLPAHAASTGSGSPRDVPKCPSWHEERVGARRAAGAGAVRRLEQLLPRPRGAVAHRPGARRCARSSSRRCCRASSSHAALVRGQRRSRSARTTLGDHAEWKVGARKLAASLWWTSRRRPDKATYFDPARAGLGRRRRGAPARPCAGDTGPSAPAGGGGRARRCACRRSVLPRGGGGDRRKPGGGERRGQAPLHARPAPIAALAGDATPGLCR